MTKNIVTIGGGSGSYSVLSAIKNLSNITITAVVPVSDSGGSTGELRKKYGIVAVGDARRAFIALGDPVNAKEMNERNFEGHPKGNLILAELEKTEPSPTHSFNKASTIFSLPANAKVVPISDSRDAELLVETEAGEILHGEHNLDHSDKTIKNVKYEHNIKISHEAKNSIIDADYIIICPGTLYGSIAPNLIVDGFNDAIMQSHAKIIVIKNIIDGAHGLEFIKKNLPKPADYIISNRGQESGLQAGTADDINNLMNELVKIII